MDPDGQTSLARIAQAGLVMYPQAQLPSFYADILDALRKAGHDAHVAQEANRTLTVLSCVAGGCGVALLPSWIRSMDFSGVRFCERASLPSFDLSAIWPARSVPTLADLFANLDLRPAGGADLPGLRRRSASELGSRARLTWKSRTRFPSDGPELERPARAKRMVAVARLFHHGRGAGRVRHLLARFTGWGRKFWQLAWPYLTPRRSWRRC